MHSLLLQKFQTWNIDSRDRLLIAFSGGLDSRVLLELVLELGFQVAIAHCNFKLRGANSDMDEQFCRDLSVSKGIEGHFTSFDTKNYAEKKGLSTQMAARELRYEFFEKLQKELDYKAVLTAHHADDQIETMLFKLARGTALDGVSGIPDSRGIFKRPLLGLYRKELESYAKEHQLTWREDESNQEDKYLRNAYRLQLIPAWERIQSDFKEKALKSGELLKEQNASLKALLSEKLDKHLKKEGEEEHLHYQDLFKQAYWFQLIYFWLEGKGNWDWSAVRNLAFTKKGRYTLTENYILAQDNGFLRLSPKKEYSQVEQFIHATDKLVNGPTFSLEIKKIPSSERQIKPAAENHYFDFEKLEFPLKIRNWQEGDKFQPLGMSGTKKVSDYLIDRKIPRHAKAEKMVLVSNGKIIALLGERIDHKYRVQNSSKTIYFVRLSYTNITS